MLKDFIIASWLVAIIIISYNIGKIMALNDFKCTKSIFVNKILKSNLEKFKVSVPKSECVIYTRKSYEVLDRANER